MSEEITLHVLGPPVPKGRPRMTRAGVTYTPAKTRRWEQTAALMAQQVMRTRAQLEGPLELVVLAEWPVPASWPRWKRREAELGQVHHTTKPDADNILKAAVDALNGVVFRDDAQIVAMIARKRYGPTPGVTIRVTPVAGVSAQCKRM